MSDITINTTEFINNKKELLYEGNTLGRILGMFITILINIGIIYVVGHLYVKEKFYN
jgi:hypothetical protein